MDNGYDDFLEATFQIEEALEGFEHISYLATVLEVPTTTVKLPRELSRVIVDLAQKGPKRGTESTRIWSGISDVDRLDKALDSIVFAFGSIFKLGLTVEQSLQALSIVMHANMHKLSMPKDAHGKLMKPKSFIGPEVELKKILDER